MNYPEYLSVKNRYCIAYFGLFDEFILQLLYLRPAIEKELPGIEICIACRDEFYEQVKMHPKLVSMSNYNKGSYSYTKNLAFNNVSHPILDLLEESNLQLKCLDYANPRSITRKCVILPNGIGAIKSMTQPEIDKTQAKAINEGYQVEINGEINEGTSWVIGVECLKFYTAAINNIRVTLVPTGFGTKFFQKTFPYGEIFN